MLCCREILSLLVFVIVYSDGVRFYTIDISTDRTIDTNTLDRRLNHLPCVCCSFFFFVTVIAQDMHVKPTNERADG